MNNEAELISLNGGEIYLTEDENDAFIVKKGEVLIYAVPLTDNMPGRRSYICSAREGEVIPAFSFRDIEYCQWRFGLVAYENAVVRRIPLGATKRLKTAFAQKAQLKNIEKEGFQGAIVDRYRLNTVTEDSFIIRTVNKQNEASDSIEELIREVTGRKSRRTKQKEKKKENSRPEATFGKSFVLKEIFSACKRNVGAKSFFVYALSVIITALLSVFLPLGARSLVDTKDIFAQNEIFIYAPVMLVSVGVALAFSFIRNTSVVNIADNTACFFQKKVYERLFTFSESFFRKYDSSVLAGRLMRTGVSVYLLMSAVLLAVSALTALLFSLGTALFFSVRLTLMGGVLLTVFSALSVFLGMLLHKSEGRLAPKRQKNASFMHQLIGGITKIRMAGVEDTMLLEYLRGFSDTLLSEEKRDGVSVVSGILKTLYGSFCTALLLVIVHFSNTVPSQGELTGFLVAFSLALAFSVQLTDALLSIRNELPFLRLIEPFFEKEEKKEEEKEGLESFTGEIALENVSFSYEGDDFNTIDGVNIKIRAGEYVGIAGVSGSGKSTLMKLLSGLESPTDGRVYFDGKDIEAIRKSDIRKSTGIVLQNGGLISGSVLENITAACPGTALQEVKGISELLGLSEDIKAMPMGYHTLLSEDSDTVSGGFVQKLLIARALVPSPSALFLDEATSALDNISQDRICSALAGLPVTRVVIAQRLSTLKRCDRIIVLSDGRVADEGGYDELMSRSSLFMALAERQLD